MAKELETEQTVENLHAFGARLEAEYQKMLAERQAQSKTSSSKRKKNKKQTPGLFDTMPGSGPYEEKR